MNWQGAATASSGLIRNTFQRGIKETVFSLLNVNAPRKQRASSLLKACHETKQKPKE